MREMHNRIHAIHMVGIGGSGMSGIAEVLLNLGYAVHGSDLADGPVVARLRELGAVISIGHASANVKDPHVLVKSTAVDVDNPEVAAAVERGIPIIPRAEMLAELMRLRTGIAIAGTHGKTTTTSFTAAIFDEAKLDPTVIIGGRLNAYGANARLGAGKYLVAEADESDGSFLCLFPIMNVVTNVDLDHLDHYTGQSDIDEAFVQFMNKVPFYGMNVVCGDDRGQHSPPTLSLYPQGADPELRARRLSAAACQRRCPLGFPPPALLHRHAGNSHISRSRSRLCRARAAQYREENRRPLPHRRV